MGKGKRVLHVIPGFGGGISSLVRNIVTNSDVNELVNDVVGFTEYPDYFANEVHANNGECFTLPKVKSEGIIACARKFCEIVKNGSYDVVHIHVYENQFVFFAVLSRMCGIKRVVAHAHISNSDHINEIKYQIKLNLWRLCENVLSTQRTSCSKLASEFIFGRKPVEQNKVMHIPNGVNIEKFAFQITEKEKESLKLDLKIANGDLVIGHVGFFGYQKNHEFMLEIIQELHRRQEKFVWLFIGDGWKRPNIENRAKQLGIDDNVRFLGRRNDVNKLFQIMDVSVLPSHFEGLPTVAVESQAAGTPVVISSAVTQEVDLHMGLARFVSLDATAHVWADVIESMAKNDKVPLDERIDTLKRLFFTAKSSTNLYQDFINGYINHYNIGDVYKLHKGE